ncbi:MAG: glucosaminidase [Gammaproteobacteria bacterium]|nr:glucosaminidase [Gammaproteobacteria bacterium]
MIAKRMLIAILIAGLPFSGYADTVKTVTKVPDFSAIKDVSAKKKAFFDFIRPIVQSENERILQVRERLISIRQGLTQTGRSPAAADQAFLSEVVDRYDVEFADPSDSASWNRLLARVDAVPLRLVLAQSANESSWGTSRFAREGRNFFGQWCFKKGCGLVPTRRKKGTRHEVRVFSSVNASVASYLWNINTGRVYASLRKIRGDLRAKGKPVTAHELAAGLSHYSERREAYVEEIRSMIRANYKLMTG